MNELCLKGFEARACVYLELWAKHADGADGARWRRMWDETCPPWMKLQEQQAERERAAQEQRQREEAEQQQQQQQQQQEADEKQRQQQQDKQQEVRRR